MKMKNRILWVVISWGLTVSALSAATYYIDYQGGSDSNNGTSKSTPWKRHPFMPGFSGSYTHAAGDDYIFKGGVVWPKEAMPLIIKKGGTAANVSEYKTDPGWFNGSAFARPEFTCGGQSIPNADSSRGNMIFLSGSSAQYVEINNFKIHRWLPNLDYNNNTDNWAVSCYSGSGNVRVRNCYLGDWGVMRLGAELSAGGGFGGDSWTGYRELIDSEVEGPKSIDPSLISAADGPELSGGRYSNGTGARNITLVSGCKIHHVTQGIWSVYVTEDSEVYECGDDCDKDVHENAIRNHGSHIIRRTWVHNVPDGTGLFLHPGWGGATPVYSHVYNNIIGPNVPQSGVGGDTQEPGNANEAWVVNNVFIDRAMTIGSRYAPWGGPTVRANNVEISDSMSLDTAFPPADSTSAPHDIRTNNVVISSAAANAAGMTAARKYKPSSAAANVTDAGLDFASGNPAGAISSLSPLHFKDDFDQVVRAAPWDRGAYELAKGTPTPTPTATPAPSPTVTPVPTATPSPTAAPTPPIPPLLAGLSFEAEAMLIEEPFAAADGLVSQGVQTTEPSEGGKLTGRVSIPVAGDYRIAIKVNAPSTASDSLFVGFDQEPTPEAIFDIPLTSGIEERIVSWRGSGEPGTPEFAPKLWHLEAGTHTLYVIGREPRVGIDSLVISATAAPTPTPTPTATPTPQPSVPPHRHTWDEIDGVPPSGTDDGAKNQERRQKDR